MSNAHLIASLSLWNDVPAPERRRVLEELAAALGTPWRAGPVRVGRRGLGALIHDRTGLTFVIVPGGWLRMGFSVDDLMAAAAARGNAERVPWGFDVDRSRPTRWVKMTPFLLATAGLPPEAGEASAGDGSAGEAYRDAVRAIKGETPATSAADADDGGDSEVDPPMRLVDPATVDELVPEGLRMPSEAELEWAFREAGTTRWVGVPGDTTVTAGNRWDLLGKLRSGFGLRGFVDKQNLCADAWSADEPRRVARSAHTYWQDDDAEVLGLHAANRYVPDEFGETILRLAADLPGAADVDLGDPGELAEDAAAVAALFDGDARTAADAVVALQLAARRPGPDLAATARALEPRIAGAAPMLRVALLAWLGNAGVEVFGAPILPLLSDKDPATRGAAVHALSTSAAAAEALRGRLAVEVDAGVRAAILLALTARGEDVAGLGTDPVTRAAIAIGHAERGDVDVDALITALEVGSVAHLVYAGGELGHRAIEHVGKLADDDRQRAAVVLARRAAAARDANLAGAAATLAFGPPPQGVAAPCAPQELTADRRAVAATLSAANLADLSPYGLPPGVIGRLRWAGAAAPSRCERTMEHEGRRRPLWCTVLDASDPAGFLARFDPVTRLAIFLDRFEYGFGRGPVREWKLEPLLAEACSRDGVGAREVVDEAIAARLTHKVSGGHELLVAMVATRSPDELDAASLAAVDVYKLRHGIDALRSFPPTALERHLLVVIRGEVAGVVVADSWVIGAHTRAEYLAPLLALCPALELARGLLILGWAGGQPAAVRAKVGEHAGDHAGLHAVLAQYDTLPAKLDGGWPGARAAMSALPGWITA